MKSILIFFFTITISSPLFAATETSSMRTSSGQLVSIGDSLSDMVARLDQSPKSMNSYEIKEGHLIKTVSDYSYEIAGVTYTFTIMNNQIRKIVWSKN